jgi:threonine-phosphate decarboxylase
VLVRGCGPFYGLGPEYFRVAVRSAEENGRLVEAIKEEL